MSFDEELNDSFKKFEEEVKAKYVKRDEAQKVLSEDKIKDKKDKDGNIIEKGIRSLAILFLKSQLKLERDDRECFYTDDYGYQITFFKVDDKPMEKGNGEVWNEPKYYDNQKPDEATLSVVFPLIEGRINTKIDRKFMKTVGPVEWGSKVIARGAGWYQYHPLEKVEVEVMQNGEKVKVLKDIYQFDNQFIKIMSKLNGVTYKNLEEIPKSEYTRHPGFRVFQILQEAK